MPLRRPLRSTIARLGRGAVAVVMVQACGVPSGSDASDGASVVQLLLRANQTSHVASIRELSTAEPVAAGSVTLELRGPEGTARLGRSAAGAWGVESAVFEGGTYQLKGLVHGAPVDWRAVMPGGLLLRSPRNGDSARLSVGVFRSTFALPFSAEASGAAGFAVEQVLRDGSSVHVQWFATGEGTIIGFITAEETYRFRIYALEEHAWRFLRGESEAGGLTGVRGFLGGAVVDSVDVVVVR